MIDILKDNPAIFLILATLSLCFGFIILMSMLLILTRTDKIKALAYFFAKVLPYIPISEIINVFKSK